MSKTVQDIASEATALAATMTREEAMAGLEEVLGINVHVNKEPT